MSDYPGAAWLARYRERVNGDAELKVIGDWFTTTFGAHLRRYPLCGEGREGADRRHRDAEARHAHAVRLPRAGRGVAQVSQPDPPPLFHDFFAMLMRVPEFVLEGDSLVAMQNARALHRMMNIMRETGAPNV